jgi:ribosomal protein L7/L12
MTQEDEDLNELKEFFPISLLEPKELEVALTLYKDSSIKALKYIREKHPELGLKEAKIYYDLYINNKES